MHYTQITIQYVIIIIIIIINLWLKAPKGATLVNKTSATDWQMQIWWDVISILLH